MKRELKDKIVNALVAGFYSICIIAILVASVMEEEKGKKEETTLNVEYQESEVIEPEPLIIESTHWIPHGVFEGTIVISGDGIESSGYEGIMYIEMDGNKIRISCTEAVRSRYGELF